MRDTFPVVAAPTPPESPWDSLPSIARLSGLGPDPWLCVLASWRVCLSREEGYALILFSAVHPIGIRQGNLTPGAPGRLCRRAPMRLTPRRCQGRGRRGQQLPLAVAESR